MFYLLTHCIISQKFSNFLQLSPKLIWTLTIFFFFYPETSPCPHFFFFLIFLKSPLPASDFPGSSISKVSTCNAGDLGLIPGLGGSPGEGNGNLFQYSCLENGLLSVGVTISLTWLSNLAHTAQCDNLWIMFQNANRSKNIASMSFFPTVSLFDLIFLGNIWSQRASVFPLSEVQNHQVDLW